MKNSALKTIYENLDGELLLEQSRKNNIGCPFYTWFSGSISSIILRKDNEDICVTLCGVLYPKLYQQTFCPCETSIYDSYIKARFWEQFSSYYLYIKKNRKMFFKIGNKYGLT